MNKYYIVPEAIMEQLIGVIDASKQEELERICSILKTERSLNEIMFDLHEHRSYPIY